jgi:hypothetical protein
MPANTNNIFFPKELKYKSWGNYEYEVDQSKSTAEKKAERRAYELFLEKAEKEREEEEKKEKKEKKEEEEEKKQMKLEKKEALNKGNIEKLKELNLKSKTQLLKKLGPQTKKCKWNSEPGGCWAHTQGKCPFKHKKSKGGSRKTRKQRRAL